MYMALDSRTLIDWYLVFHGRWEPHLDALFQRLLEPGAVAVDVGANVGAHTLTFARLVGPTGRVLAFEPNPAIRDRLVNNVNLNGLKQTTVYGCALGAAAATLDLRVPSATSAEASNPGLASLVALDTPHDLVKVTVRSLDDVVADAQLQRVDLVKIDVQGYESHTLQGMRETIARFSPAIIFEFEDWAWQRTGATFAEVAKWFQSAGYAFWKINRRTGRVLRGQHARLAPVAPNTIPGAHADLLALRNQDPRLDRLQQVFEVAHG
jgi:FkbM family methyltransferase